MLDISLKNAAKIKKVINDLRPASERVLQSTVNDFKTRAPGWVRKEITKVYNIKPAEITPGATKKVKGSDIKAAVKQAGNIRAAGDTIDSARLIYSGRLLTPSHFSMKPTKRPLSARDENGRVRKKAGTYTVSAEIFKGARKNLGSDVFLGSNKGNGYIPFQRMGSSRYPIKSVKTLSVPQMIASVRVAPAIAKSINDNIAKRFDHYAKREL